MVVVACLAVLLLRSFLLGAETSEPVVITQSAPAVGVYDFIEVTAAVRSSSVEQGSTHSLGHFQGRFATAANPLGFHVLAWTVPLEAAPQPLPAKARTPNHFAQGRCRANTPMFGAGGWI